MRVFLDTETGGVLSHHPLVQLAAIVVDKDWKEVATFERKILFEITSADPKALEINHYTPEAWKDALPERVVVQEFEKFLDPFRLVELTSKRSGKPYKVASVGGHNVTVFDLPRLQTAFKRWGTFFPVHYQRVLDTLQGAVWYFEKRKEQPADMKLSSLANFFGFETAGAHDALVDCRISARLAQRFLTPP